MEIGPSLPPVKVSPSFNAPTDPGTLDRQFLLEDTYDDEFSDFEGDFGQDIDDEDIQMEDNLSDTSSDFGEGKLGKDSQDSRMESSVSTLASLSLGDDQNTLAEDTNSASDPAPTTPPAISALPALLAFIVAENLPLSSVVALSLCCHSLYNVIGARYSRALNRSTTYPPDGWYFSPLQPFIPTPPGVTTVEFRYLTPAQRQLWHRVLRKMLLRKERKAFIQILSRDLPLCVNCPRCLYLHKPHKPTEKGVSLWSYTDMRQVLCDSEGIEPGFFPYKTKTYPQISCSQIQMAVQLHQKNRVAAANIQLEALFGNSKYIKDEFNRTRERKHVWISKPKIINQKLYVRSQHWFLMPRHAPENEGYLSSLSYAVDSFHFMEEPRYEDGFTAENVICPHVKMNTVGYYPVHEGRMMKPSKDKCCRCGIEYQLDAKDYYPSGIAFVITTWRNLGTFNEHRRGDFKSLEPTPDITNDSLVCYGHSGRMSGKCGESDGARRQRQGLWTDEEVRENPRGVRKAFEDGDKFVPEDCLSTEDRVFLFGRSNVEVFWKNWMMMRYC